MDTVLKRESLGHKFREEYAQTQWRFSLAKSPTWNLKNTIHKTNEVIIRQKDCSEANTSS